MSRGFKISLLILGLIAAVPFVIKAGFSLFIWIFKGTFR
jgi:hypothetical protein